VFVEKESSKQESFASAKVVIDTLSMNPIEDEAIIQVEDKGFRVSVFETKTEFTIFHTGPLEEAVSSPYMFKCNDNIANMGSNGNVVAQVNLAHEDSQKDHSQDKYQGDREDDQTLVDRSILNLKSIQTHHIGQPRGSLNGSINATAVVEKNQQVNDARVDGERSERLLGEPPLIDIGDEGVKGQVAGRRVSTEAISASSSTKTKSAQFSGYGYSEEMEKIYQHGSSFQAVSNQLVDLGNEMNLSDSSNVQQENDLPHVPQESDLSLPPGFGIAEDVVPPGF